MAYNPLTFGLMIVALGALTFAAYLYRHYKNTMSPAAEKGFGLQLLTYGAIAGLFGFGIYFLQPIPAQYIEIYGVGYFVFSMMLIIGGISMLCSWDKKSLAVLAAISGIILLHSAYLVLKYSLSRSPLATAGLFGFAALGCISSAVLARDNIIRVPKWHLIAAIIVFTVCGLLALYSGLMAHSGHVLSALLES